MNNANVISLDLAKNIIQVCKISTHGELISNKAISPQSLKELLSNSVPSIVALEGCGSCHYWGRLARSYGHRIRIIAPKRVNAFLQGQKTEANDALAIAAAAMQLGVRFCPVKEIDQSSLQTVETSRKFLSRDPVALSNPIRGYLYEYGMTIAKGKKSLRETMIPVLENGDTRLPESLKATLLTLWERDQLTDDQIKKVEQDNASLVKQVEPCKRVMDVEGVGEVCASMLYASLGDGREFNNGRQASVYIGLTPKQHSSGGKIYMTGIDKNGGNKELRSALYQGALSVISRLPAEAKTSKQSWLIALVQRVGIKRACIALANKTVRTAWALLTTGKSYQPVLSNS